MRPSSSFELVSKEILSPISTFTYRQSFTMNWIHFIFSTFLSSAIGHNPAKNDLLDISKLLKDFQVIAEHLQSINDQTSFSDRL